MTALNWRLVTVLLCISIVVSSASARPAHHKRNVIPPPVILIPGDGGTQLFAKLNRTSAPHYICAKHTKDFFLLWLDITAFFPIRIDCLADNMRLVFNPEEKRSESVPGVEVQVQGWGDTTTVEYLSNLHIEYTEYFYPVVNMLVNKLGYIRGKNVRGAPYDFRRAPTEYHTFFDDFKRLIEETYAMNENTPVVLLGHSMGCLYSHHFLVRQSQEWKDKYIHTFISSNGPYGGAVTAILAEVSGDDLDVRALEELTLSLRSAQRSWTTTAYLMPTPGVWQQDEVLVMSPQRNYTVADYQSMFTGIGYAVGFDILQSISNITDHRAPPQVRTYCILSNSVPTAGQLDYRHTGSSFPNVAPYVILDDGDGTVNWRSQVLCSAWDKKQRQPVTTQVVPGAPHLEIVRDRRFVNLIEDIIVQAIADDAYSEWTGEKLTHW